MLYKLGDLQNVHKEGDCAAEHCNIHNPSDHPLNKAPLYFRVRGGILISERICEHGTGHPDPDWLTYLSSIGYTEDEVESEALHGCCGCC